MRKRVGVPGTKTSMRRSNMARLLLVALVVLASTALATPWPASAQQTGATAEIRQGNCDEVGDVVSPLVEARLPAGDRRGHPAAMPAANSFTTVPLSLDALTASDHAIVVPFPVEDELVACGDIGGTLIETGALIVGLAPQGDEGISGIAYLSPGAGPAQTNVSLFISGEELDTFLGATFLPLTVADEDAARFAGALAARDGARQLAGPIGNPLPQAVGVFLGSPAGIAVADFSATVTFVNPRDPSEIPWDVGIAFHVNLEQQLKLRGVYLDSGGSWYYTDILQGGIQQSGAAPTFDPSPGGVNTLDLIVDGGTALFGANGAFVARIELPGASSGDVMAATNFHVGNVEEGREITFSNFQVWEAPDLASLPATPAASVPDDASRFAAALAGREATSRVAGPFADALVQRQGSLAMWGSETTPERFSTTVTFGNLTEQTETPSRSGS
jgi:hypothetical protein